MFPKCYVIYAQYKVQILKSQTNLKYIRGDCILHFPFKYLFLHNEMKKKFFEPCVMGPNQAIIVAFPTSIAMLHISFFPLAVQFKDEPQNFAAWNLLVCKV